MSRADLWLVIIGGMFVTYLIRLSFIQFIPQERLPDWFRRGLAYVPPAVLAGVIFPAMLMPEGHLDISLGNTRLLAGVVAIGVAWLTRNVWLTMLAGLVALWLVGQLG